MKAKAHFLCIAMLALPLFSATLGLELMNFSTWRIGNTMERQAQGSLREMTDVMATVRRGGERAVCARSRKRVF